MRSVRSEIEPVAGTKVSHRRWTVRLVRDFRVQANANNHRPDLSIASAYLVPFLLVGYLGLREGGYELTVFGEAGILAWWGVLLIALAGRPALRRPAPAAQAVLAVLVALAAWTALGLLFGDSPGRTAIELARIATYGGVFALAVMLWRPGAGRRMLGGVGAAIVVLGLIALASRLRPGLFGPNELAGSLVGVESRLAYPIQYWNGLASLIAVGLPLVVWGAATARTQLVRSLAAAVAPLLVLVVYLTISRGGAVAAAAGLVALVALYPVRTALIPTAATTLVGGSILVGAASARAGFTSGLDEPLARQQGLEMLAVCLVVAVAVGLLHLGLGRLVGAFRVWFPRISHRRALLATGASFVVVVAVAVALGAPSRAANAFDDFRNQSDPGRSDARLASASGNGRWQYWSAAAHEGEENPLVGTGAGTFEFYWEEHGILPGFVRDAHSLYIESFGELGAPGLLIVLTLTGVVLLGAGRRALRAFDAHRAMLAAAAGACAAFFVGAAVDWLWELPAIPIAMLFCAATTLAERPRVTLFEAAGPGPVAAGSDAVGHASVAAGPVAAVAGSAPDAGPRLGVGDASERTPLRRAIGLSVVAVVALVVIVPPYMAQRGLDDSAALRAGGDAAGARAAAERATSWQPFAAAPHLQLAVIDEDARDFTGEVDQALLATEKEPTNWENWYVLARARSFAQKPAPALRAFRRARRLNPFSNLLDVPLIGSERALAAQAKAAEAAPASG